MMWWLVWSVVVAAAIGESASASSPESLSGDSYYQIPSFALQDSSGPDNDIIGYERQQPNKNDAAICAYVLDLLARNRQREDNVEAQNDDLAERRSRPKRKMPSLSISNPMEVLRQRLMMEVARKQMREANQRQAFANRLFLQNVGKRGFWKNSAPSHYQNN